MNAPEANEGINKRLQGLLAHILRNENEHEMKSMRDGLRRLMDKEGITHGNVDFFNGVGKNLLLSDQLKKCRANLKKSREKIRIIEKYIAALLIRLPDGIKFDNIHGRRWLIFTALAHAKLGEGWRKHTEKVFGVTQRQIEMWYEGESILPEAVLEKLAEMPDDLGFPVQPEPVVADESDEESSFAGMGDNIVGGLSEDEGFAMGRDFISDLIHRDRRTSAKGVNLGRLALEMVRRFRERPKRRGHTQKKYLLDGFGGNISVLNRWMSAARIVDDTAVKWSEVEQYCNESNFTTASWGADKIRAMRKAHDAR